VVGQLSRLILPQHAVGPGFNMYGEGVGSGLQRKLAAVANVSELGISTLQVVILLVSRAADRIAVHVNGLRIRKLLPATKESPLSGQLNADDRIYVAFLQAKDLLGPEQEALLARLALTPQELAEVRVLLVNVRPAGSQPSPLSDIVGNLKGDFAGAAMNANSLVEGSGTRIGQYKILQRIGEGGFGSVFMAEQEKPVSRKVAIKIIKLGMDTRQVVARFEQERQALALMDHPNIARVLDAGATETGRPYFVMDLVKGDPIVEYCDKNNLSIEDRLELFVQVCDAVQHAHSKGIIHRDIKPSNILVSTQDGKPHPKVIDFGIAKATATKLTEKTVFTEHRQLIGTPEYMSPEQAEGSLDIDTRTDVYSLGVLLYELLTGKRPYSFRTRLRAEVLRVVQEEEPSAPSTAITRAEQVVADDGTAKTLSPEQLAKSRDETVSRLQRRLRGDLDNIVLMALQKLPRRRYASASELSADIQRHLSGFPVQARPDTFLYAASRFARRHRYWLSGAAAVLLTTGISGGVVIWKAGQVRQREAQLAKVRELVNSAVLNITGKLEREEGSLQSRQVLSLSGSQILDALAGTFPNDDKLTFERAVALRAIADTQGGRGMNTGQTAEAKKNYQRAYALAASDLSEIPADRMTAFRLGLLSDIADVERRTGSADAAKATITQAMKLLDATPTAIRNSASIRQASSQVLLARAGLAEADGQDETALADINESIRIRRELLGEDRSNPDYLRDLTVGLVRLADRAQQAEDYPSAITLFREILNLRRTLDVIVANATSKRDLALAHKFVGDVLVDSGDLTAATTEFDSAMTLLMQLREASPDDVRVSRDVATLHESVGFAAQATGDHEAAVKAFGDSVSILRPLVKNDPSNSVVAREFANRLFALGTAKAETNDVKGARAALTEAQLLLTQLQATKPSKPIEQLLTDVAAALGKLPS
jgi:serine/threonine protein kinase